MPIKKPQPTKPKKVELLSKVVGTAAKVNRDTFKESVIGLFEDALNSEDFSQEDKRVIARLRAKVQIEF